MSTAQETKVLDGHGNEVWPEETPIHVLKPKQTLSRIVIN